MSYEELVEWNYYLHSEPSESEKIRHQLAVHTANSMSVQGVKDAKVSDYFLDFNVSSEIETDEISELEKARQKNKSMKKKLLTQLKGE